jgi:dTDP-4-dehydrorhamnose reductase
MNVTTSASKKILVLGASGMLGSMVFSFLNSNLNFDVRGTVRSNNALPNVKSNEKVFINVNAEDVESIELLIKEFRPEYIVNCIGLIKQDKASNDPMRAITINSLLPHHLAKICKTYSLTLIHISTDCVFSGKAGNYVESDTPDPLDLYGVTKLLGEISGELNVITFRTSLIGPELSGSKSLLSWFLSSTGTVKGYTNAIFSGLTTLEMAKIITMVIEKNLKLSGLYHLASKPISKYDLLLLVRNIYKKDAEIEKDDSYKIDRSLDSSKFKRVTNYSAPEWKVLISDMKNFGK